MVVIIMAVLMVSFLIGMQGFQMIFRPNPESIAIGTTSFGSIDRRDLRQARSDVDIILRRYVGLGSAERMLSFTWPSDLEFLTLITGKNPYLTYALLWQEAQNANVLVTEADIDRFFRRIDSPVGSETYRTMVSTLKARLRLAEKHLRAAVGRWLTIQKVYRAAAVDVPPSELQLRRYYRDLNERISVRVARIPAERFLEEIAEPSEDEIQAQFDQFRAVPPGTIPAPTSFGFGYKQPARVRILYMFISRNVIQRVIQPSDSDVRLYFRKHRSEFVREIPPASQPAAPTSETAANQPTTKVATQPAEVRTVPMSFSEAKPHVIERLKPLAVQNKLEDLVAIADGHLREYEKAGPSDPNPYERVKSRMTRSAEAILATKLPIVEIRQEPLDRAIEKLAKKANIQAICYPFRTASGDELNPSVRVTLSGREISLSEALRQIGQQAKWPESGSIQWAMCEGLAGVLFPVDEKWDLFPIKVQHSGLLAGNELAAEPIISASFTPAGQPLLQMAFLADAFVKTPRATALVRVNEDAPPMVVAGQRPGRLLWRLTQATPDQAPEKITDDLREQIVADIKSRKAFLKAMERAKELLEAAKKDGLEATAKSADLETITTGWFPRQVEVSPQEQLLLAAMERGGITADVFQQAMLQAPAGLGLPSIEGIELPLGTLRQRFIETAFSLVPKDVQPKPGETPYPEEPYALTAIDIPHRKEVLLLQRADFAPAVAGEYEQTGRKMILNFTRTFEKWRMRSSWFGLAFVQKRVGFAGKPR